MNRTERREFDFEPLRAALATPGREVTVSMNEAAAILKVGRTKIAKMLGTKLRVVRETQGKKSILLYDLVKPLVEQGMMG